MNYKFWISECMFWHVIIITVCIFSTNLSSGTNKAFSQHITYINSLLQKISAVPPKRVHVTVNFLMNEC